MVDCQPGHEPVATPACIVCGYDLRGSNPEGNCPECGAAVERSLHGDWLRDADQVWVATVLRGLSWVWTSLGLLLAFFAAIVLTLPVVLFTDPLRLHPALHWGLWAVSIGALITFALAVIGFAAGLWMVTSPEPRTAMTQPFRRWTLRTLTIAIAPVMASIVVNLGGPAALVVVPGWGGLILAGAAPVLIGAQAWLLLSHIRSLEQRCGGFDEERAKVLAKYQRGVTGFAVVIVALTLCISVIRSIDTGTGVMTFVWLAAVSQVGETRRRIRAELVRSVPVTREGAG